ncbi:MAG: PAS domain S-box protein, partial [Phycisphaerae bacterium]|nr:PAS domain S-box protein [Phycisphaerae bacterium]
MRKKQASGRKENESETLRESGVWLRLIMEKTSDGIVITEYDPKTDKRRLVMCNDRYVEMSGRSREELMRSEDLNEFLRWKAARGGLIRDHLLDDVFLDGVRLEGTASWLRPDGKDNCYEWTATSLKAGDKYHIIGIDRDATEQRRVEEALRASELQYQATLNSIGDAIHVVDKDLRIVLCNPALVQWCKQLGLESNPVGMTVFEAFPFLSEEVRDELHHVFQTGETLINEEINKINNEEFNTETRKIPILENGKVAQIVTVIRDITVRKKSEDRIRRLAMIAEQAVEGIGMADLDGILQFVNPSWARMHGYETGEELVGEHIGVFHTAEQMKTHVNPFNEKVKRTGRHMGESEQTRKDGTTFPSEMAITLFKDEEGEPVGMLAFVIDITDRKKAEEALRESEYDLRMRVRELNCLYHITEVVNKCNDSLDDLLKGIV